MLSTFTEINQSNTSTQMANTLLVKNVIDLSYNVKPADSDKSLGRFINNQQRYAQQRAAQRAALGQRAAQKQLGQLQSAALLQDDQEEVILLD